jgi:hypothetical protein
MHMNFPIRTREILRFCFLSILRVMHCLSYFLLIAIMLQTALHLLTYAKPQTRKNSISPKSVYFSIVTFHTIGYGDIHPVTKPRQNTW